MATFSLCMIVKNEEEVLGRCLLSALGIFDEIIIVDTGSDDATKEIARQFTDQIYDFEWIDDFSAARNFAFSKAACEYCVWLDADDVIPPDSREKLIQLKKSLPKDTDCVMVKYNVAFDRNGKASFSYYRERILRNCPLARWSGAVHETIAPFGKQVYSDIAIEHRKEKQGDSGRNLRIYESQIKKGGAFTPRDRFYYSRELYYARRFEDAIVQLELFLLEGKGWVENNIDACRILSYCLNGTGQRKEALRALLKSFEYDSPRAELCCDIGKHFFEQNSYKQAIYWYSRALESKIDDQSCAFIMPECYGYIPAIQLSLCHWHLGDIDTAITFNELAESFKADDPAVLSNRKFYSGYKEKAKGIEKGG
ncbi:MAG: glycosyltransferase [Christensenellales bacterium]|jgi:glycosyltransferase involved in cell wall biosynthesis